MKKITLIITGIFFSCILAVMVIVPDAARAATSSAPHATLTGLKGFPGYDLSTGWFGFSKFGLTLQFDLGVAFGGTLARVDLNGSGSVDLVQNRLWFTGTSSTAEMNVGIETWAKYWVKGFGIDREGDLPFIDTFDWRFYDRRTVYGNPYFLHSSLTLTDGLSVDEVIGKSYEFGKLTLTASLDLRSTAYNTIRGRYLSTYWGTFYSTGSSDQKPVAKRIPVLTVPNIVQSSRSSWSMDVTPTAVFAVSYSWWLNYEYELPIYTFPFNLGSFTFQTSPRSLSICTGQYYPDRDNDGWAVPGTALIACSDPAYYSSRLTDCDDTNRNIYPGATELPNGVDDDCDDTIDEGFQIYYHDADSDGYGDPNNTQSAVPGEQPEGYVDQAGDCNDADSTINAGAREVCRNNIDDNCNGQTDEVCHPPVAHNVLVMTDEDNDASVYLDASDEDGDALSYIVVTNPAHGTLSGNAPSLVYVPAANYYGPDSFTYTASDRDFTSAAATVSITVNPVNDQPVADAGVDQTLVVNAVCEATATLNGIASSDIDGDTLAYRWTWNGSTISGSNPNITLQAGTKLITLHVHDGQVSSQPDTLLVTALDQTLPTITPDHIVAECLGPEGQDIDIVSPAVSDNCCDKNDIILSYSAPSEYYLGQNQVDWTAIDCHGNTADAIQQVTIQDTLNPDISVRLSPDILWPPNHKMIEVVPSIQTVDICCGSNVTVKLESATMDEGDADNTFDPLYDIDPNVGYIGDDIQIIDGRIYLRAERAGNSSGRVYTLNYSATDCVGNVSRVTSFVTVPHDQR